MHKRLFHAYVRGEKQAPPFPPASQAGATARVPGFIGAVLSYRLAPGSAAGITLFIIQPDTQFHPAALFEHKTENLPLFFIL